ncbi:hypothetical protein T492DRAFT_918282 [Pavlovales sp. CCMP2436]|nr:hypothetical protein T492DRAFT_918282 [Pavlovales sp. CCMP2436]
MVPSIGGAMQPLAALGVSVFGFAAINLFIGINMYGELGVRNRAAMREWAHEREERRKAAS